MSPDDSPPKSTSRSRGRRGLGRGLESLIPTTPRATTNEATKPSGDDHGRAGSPLDVPIAAIRPNPWQPRTTIDDQQMDELAQSVRIHGVMQPLIVSAGDNGEYVLIAGERRWRAAKQVGLATVPVVIRDATPQAMLELAIIENVVRADLSPLEEAHAYKQLIDDFGLTQAAVAERVGRSRVSITNTLRLLNAPEQVLEALAVHRITEGHARALLGLPGIADQLALLEQVVSGGLSVRQTETLVRKWLSGPTPKRARARTSPAPENLRVESRLRDALGTQVSLRNRADQAGGTITIHFYSDEQLQSLYDRIVGEELW